MTFAEALPYITAMAAAAQILAVIAGWLVFLRTQATQHQANISRLDQLSDRVKAMEEIGRQQTAILVSNGRLEERLKGHADRLEGHDQRIGRLENHDAGRRISAAKGG